MLSDIEALQGQIRDAAAGIEAARALPDVLIADLHAAGAFRALIPRQFGGLDAPFEDYVRSIQNLATADASTAWCVNQAAVIGVTSLWLPEAQIREIWSPSDTAIANGPPFDARIEPHGEGYLLNGHWGFSSGCQHATWMMGAARFSEGGWRIAYFRPEDVAFIDNWQVAGLRGTGSFEFRIENLNLPAHQVADQGEPATVDCEMTRVPLALLFAVSFAGVALGVSHAALDDMLEIAQGKLPRYASLRVKDDPDAQRFVGKAQARWRAADVYLHSTVADVLGAVRTGGSVTNDHRAALRMAGTHVIRECADVLDLAYKIVGSTGIYQDHPMQRRFQDMHVITQHVQAREAHYGLLGRYAISGEYELGPMS